MNRINNITELRAEIARVKQQVKEQEELIKTDIKDIGEGLRPVNLLMSAMESATGIDLNKKDILKKGLGYILSYIIQRYVFKAELKVEHKISEWMEELILRIKKFFNKIKHPEGKEEQSEGNANGVGRDS